jgi:hypothetical protein
MMGDSVLTAVVLTFIFVVLWHIRLYVQAYPQGAAVPVLMTVRPGRKS